MTIIKKNYKENDITKQTLQVIWKCILHMVFCDRWQYNQLHCIKCIFLFLSSNFLDSSFKFSVLMQYFIRPLKSQNAEDDLNLHHQQSRMKIYEVGHSW